MSSELLCFEIVIGFEIHMKLEIEDFGPLFRHLHVFRRV